MKAHEQWRPVTKYENYYEVSSRGEVRRIAGGRGTKRGRILKKCARKDGYYCVNLSVRSAVACCLIHRLVAEAFFGHPPENAEVNHKDFNRSNNSIENLEYVSSVGNRHHAIDGGHHPFKRKTPQKLSWENVYEIRKLYSCGHRLADIARTFNVDPSTVSKIAANKQRVKE